MAELKELAEQLVNLTIKEANELATILEEEHGIKPAAAAAVVAGPGAGAEAVEAQTEFDVILTGVAGNKIAVIKEVRAITGLGLKEAKGIVDGAPSPIQEAASKDQAEELKTRLEEAGATVELK